MAAETNIGLDLSTLQALSDPQSAARMYCELHHEKTVLAQQLGQLEAALHAHTTMPSTYSSDRDRLCEMLGQLHQLAEAAVQESADMLSGCSNRTSGMFSNEINDSRGLGQEVTGRSSAPELQYTLQRRDEEGLWAWGSGISESFSNGSRSHSGNAIAGTAGGGFEPLRVAAAPPSTLAGSNQHLPSQGVLHNDQSYLVTTHASSPQANQSRMAIWGSGAGTSMSGRSNLPSSLDGAHEPATVRLTSRLAISSGTSQPESTSLQAWGSGVSPRWSVRASIEPHRESTGTRNDDGSDLAQQLQAALGQVEQLQHQRELLEKACHQLQQQVLQMHGVLQKQQHKLLLMDGVIREMQSVAQPTATS